MYVKRQLDLLRILQEKSYFLFGPRQTGKTSLIRIADIFLLFLALKRLVSYTNSFYRLKSKFYYNAKKITYSSGWDGRYFPRSS
jgi:predicted AAA+ superfamily ATPase